MQIAFSRNEEIHEILLKYNQGIELNAKEDKKLNTWLARDEKRGNYFSTLKELINIENELATASGDDKIDSLLEEIKACSPELYSKFPKDIKIIARTSLIFSIDEDRKTIISRIAYGNRWVAMIAAIVRVIVVVALLLIFISCISH